MYSFIVCIFTCSRQLQQFAGITTSVDEVAQACNLPIPRDCSVSWLCESCMYILYVTING